VTQPDVLVFLPKLRRLKLNTSNIATDARYGVVHKENCQQILAHFYLFIRRPVGKIDAIESVLSGFQDRIDRGLIRIENQRRTGSVEPLSITAKIYRRRWDVNSDYARELGFRIDVRAIRGRRGCRQKHEEAREQSIQKNSQRTMSGFHDKPIDYGRHEKAAQHKKHGRPTPAPRREHPKNGHR
jgi:hypothetical protein